ncbi:Molybdenum cofactor sulfurase [Varanus komodoensis]|nr:Molybdenum cofactor sulfurase [Varanus komodoensis]
MMTPPSTNFGMDPVSVTLEENNESQTEICQSKVCSHRVQTYDCGERAADWFSEFLGRQCRLIRQSSDFKRNANKKDKKGIYFAWVLGRDSSSEVTSLSLVNEAPYLLINRTSISQLRDQVVASPISQLDTYEGCEVLRQRQSSICWPEIRIAALVFAGLGPWLTDHLGCYQLHLGPLGEELCYYNLISFPLLLWNRLGESVLPHELIYRFRANMVISTNEAFEEDLWEEIAIGTLHFKVMGPCHRCLVICIDQQTGQRNKEFLQSLAAIKDRKVSIQMPLKKT